MLAVPERNTFLVRDDFVAAVTAAFGELWDMYEAEPVRSADPDWTRGSHAYNVALPIAVARNEGDAHGMSSLLKHMIEKGHRSIERIARVERDGRWIVWVEAR